MGTTQTINDEQMVQTLLGPDFHPCYLIDRQELTERLCGRAGASFVPLAFSRSIHPRIGVEKQFNDRYSLIDPEM